MGLPQSYLEAMKETETEAVHKLDHLFGHHQGEVLFETGIERESATHLNAIMMSNEATTTTKTTTEGDLAVHSENMITVIIRAKSVSRRVMAEILLQIQHE